MSSRGVQNSSAAAATAGEKDRAAAVAVDKLVTGTKAPDEEGKPAAAAVREPASADEFLSAIQVRRTHYGVSAEIPIPASRVVSIVETAVLHTPSPFNSQCNRVIVLIGAPHIDFWDLAADTLLSSMDEGRAARFRGRFEMFRSAAGTVLFFEDTESAAGLAKALPGPEAGAVAAGLVADSDAMLQYIVWTALALEKVGASLQHVTSDALDQKVGQKWGMSWHLKAQLVFGGIRDESKVKEFMPLADRLKVFGA